MSKENTPQADDMDTYWLPSNGYTLEQGILVEMTKRLLAGAFDTVPGNVRIEVFVSE